MERNNGNKRAVDRLRICSRHLSTPALTAHQTSSNSPAVFDAGLGQATESSNVQYVMKNSVLSPEQERSFNEKGFLVIRNLVPHDKIDAYRKEFDDICCTGKKVPTMTVMKDVAMITANGDRAVNKIQDFQDNKVLFSYCSLPEILRYVECFTGANIMAMHTMLINKPPDPGTKTSRHPMHQDLHYFPFRPAERIVCSWTAMEKVHLQNGCLVVVPGSHKGMLKEHGYPQWEGGVNKAYHGLVDFDESAPRIHLEMEKGDTVFFHPLLHHGSGANKTKGFRKAISCHYAASDCHFIDVSGTTQASIAEEVEELARKRLGPDIQFDFKDIWNIKGRLVKGERLTL